MVEMTIQVPEPLAARLETARTRIPEVLERGLGATPALPNQIYRYILAFLSRNPSATEIAEFGPTREMQERVSALLSRQREAGLTDEESGELDEYLRIDHLITLIKARALSILSAHA